MFITDFDDTLFDMHRLKQIRMDALQALGISDEEYKRTYVEARNASDGIVTYSNRRHAEVLAMYGHNESKVFRALESSLQPALLKQHVLPDVDSFLQRLRSYAVPLILLSLGDEGFQEAKVKGCGIHDYFDRCYFVQDSKIHILRELFSVLDESEAWFFNDKVSETLEIHKAFPAMKIVLRQSPNIAIEEYAESGLPYFKTLKEIEKYVIEAYE